MNNKQLLDEYYDAYRGDDNKIISATLQAIMNYGDNKIGDYYLVGERFFEIQQYELAIKMLTKSIDMGLEQAEGWYADSAYLLRAYAFIEIGKYKEAKEDIDFVADDTRIAWLYRHPEPEINKLLVIQKLNALTAKTPSATPNRKHSPKPR